MTANGNKTVVITTHYIEEARQAHTVSNNLKYCTYYLVLFVYLAKYILTDRIKLFFKQNLKNRIHFYYLYNNILVLSMDRYK